MRDRFEVIVGNIGTVYSGNDYDLACSKFHSYVKQAKAHHGRAAGEDVTMLDDSEVRLSHVGYMTKQDAD